MFLFKTVLSTFQTFRTVNSVDEEKFIGKDITELLKKLVEVWIISTGYAGTRCLANSEAIRCCQSAKRFIQPTVTDGCRRSPALVQI